MRHLSRAALVSGATGLLAALAFAVPARAGQDFHAKCTTVVGDVKANPPIQLTGGKGRYVWDDVSLTCVIRETPPTKIVTLSATFDSPGSYKNFFCGTMKLVSDNPGIFLGDIDVSANSKIGEAGYGAFLSDLKYEMEFVATQGLLFWHGPKGKLPDTKPASALSPKPYEDKDRYRGGEVKMVPPGPDKPNPFPDLGCGKSFGVMAPTGIDITNDPLI